MCFQAWPSNTPISLSIKISLLRWIKDLNTIVKTTLREPHMVDLYGLEYDNDFLNMTLAQKQQKD